MIDESSLFLCIADRATFPGNGPSHYPSPINAESASCIAYYLSQIMVHPWLMQSRVMYHSVGSHYRPARVEAGNGSSPLAIKGRESQQREEGARGTGCVAAFHISSDPRRDLCAQSVKRMEAFGVDGGEITRQVSLHAPIRAG